MTLLKNLEKTLCSRLFLAVCIVASARAGLSLMGGSVEVFSILFSIGFWLIFAAAKNSTLAESRTGLSMVSGTVKAELILIWVAVGILAVCGVIILIMSPLASNLSEAFMSELAEELRDTAPNLFFYITTPQGTQTFDLFDIKTLSPAVITAFMAIIGVVLLVIAAIFTLLNIFYYRNVHKLTKSVCVSFESGTYSLAKLKTAKTWFLVMGILDAVSFTSSLSSGKPFEIASGACSVALYFLYFVLAGQVQKAEADAGTEETDTLTPVPGAEEL